MKVAVIGTGAYGLALAKSLTKKDNQIIVWSENEDKINEVKKTGMIQSVLPNVKLPKELKYTNSLEEAVYNQDLILIVVATKYVGDISKKIKSYLSKNTHVCICSKGIDIASCNFVSEVFYKYNPRHKRLAIISGPSFAIDILNSEPVALTVASKSFRTIETVQKALVSDTLKLRSTSDLIGIQICGSIKNIVAIASGIITGLGYSDSTRAFLITESLHDIKELISGLGGNKKSILSYAGVGDLLLTCTSVKSRNYSYGILIGAKKYQEANNYLNTTTVEGYYTLKSIYKLIKRKKIKIPIMDLMYKIIMNNDNPELIIEFLINKK